MRRQQILCILLIFLSLLLYTPVLAQEPTSQPTPDAQAVLNRANEVAQLAQDTIDQTTRTLNLIEKLAWFFGIIVAVATVALGMYGFNAQRGFQETMKEYHTQLEEIRTTHQQQLSEYVVDQKRVQVLEAEMADKVAMIEQIRAELGQFKETIKQEFEKAKLAVVLLSFGNRLVEEGKWPQAIDAYKEAQRVAPNDPEINYRLGRVYSNSRQFKDAIQTFQHALDLRPDYAEVNMELGLAYRRQGDSMESAEERKVQYGLAEHYLYRAIELRAGYDDALSTLGGLYRREGRYEEALLYYKSAMAYDQTSYALNNVASLALYLGQEVLAHESFRRAEGLASKEIRSGREKSWRLYDRALARLVLGNHAGALIDHKAAIALTPAVEHFHSVLDNLHFLQEGCKPIEGLDEFINLVEEALQQRSSAADAVKEMSHGSEQ